MKKAGIGFSVDQGKEVQYDLNSLTQHAAILGTTGSGKTVMCKVVIEEALASGIPVIAIDPKGDIGGLGVTNKTFDFTPFVAHPEKTQSLYLSNFQDFQPAKLDALSKVKTKIFTPKSSVGLQVSLVPDLAAPKDFKTELEKDASLPSSLIDPLSESLCQLAGLTANYEKAKSLISSLILYNWSAGQDLTLESLIGQILNPPFTQLGTLSMDDFLKEQDRKKIASSINLILSSPSKQAWKAGSKLDVEALLKPGNLSIFDLRFTGSTEEKQYAIEQILQELYRFLLHRGGTDKLQYILYIDELAGILPPPPANPPCKKSLEILIRQARAFGLGIILATQNPGDIDYKVLGNIGTRFIGKLRTENDMDKVATAIGISLATLKEALITFKTGDFFYNNAVENKSLKIHARWLYSYHAGPLLDKDIGWINHPETRPINENPLELPNISAPKKTLYSKAAQNHSLTILKKLKAQIAQYADTTQTLVVESPAGEYLPLLCVTIEPKPFNRNRFPVIGPYIFDLSNKTDPQAHEIQSSNWKALRRQSFHLPTPKRSIKKSIYQAVKDSQAHLKKRLYASKVTQITGEEKGMVIKSNYDFMKEELLSATRVLIEKGRRKEMKILAVQKANKHKLNSIRNRTSAIKAGRLVKRLFGNHRLSDKTREIRKKERLIRKLRQKNKLLQLKIAKNRQETKEKIKSLESKLYQKSHTLTKSLSYNPARKDLLVHANILLYPVK